MKRRDFLKIIAAAPVVTAVPVLAKTDMVTRTTAFRSECPPKPQNIKPILASDGVLDVDCSWLGIGSLGLRYYSKQSAKISVISDGEINNVFYVAAHSGARLETQITNPHKILVNIEAEGAKERVINLSKHIQKNCRPASDISFKINLDGVSNG